MGPYECSSPVLRSPRLMQAACARPTRSRSVSLSPTTPALNNARRKSTQSTPARVEYAWLVARACFRVLVPLLLVLSALCCCTQLVRIRRRPLLSYDGVIVDPARPHQRFTGTSTRWNWSDLAAVMVFSGAAAPQYFPTMFRSAAANARDLDLLFVNIQDSTGACLDLAYLTDRTRATYAPNVKHLCLSVAENDALISRWLCRGWGGCSTADQRAISAQLERLRTELSGPDTFSTLRVRRPCKSTVLTLAAFQRSDLSCAH